MTGFSQARLSTYNDGNQYPISGIIGVYPFVFGDGVTVGFSISNGVPYYQGNIFTNGGGISTSIANGAANATAQTNMTLVTPTIIAPTINYLNGNPAISGNSIGYPIGGFNAIGLSGIGGYAQLLFPANGNVFTDGTNVLMPDGTKIGSTNQNAAISAAQIAANSVVLNGVTNAAGSGGLSSALLQPSDSDLTNLANRIIVNIGLLSGSNGVVQIVHADGTFTNFFGTDDTTRGNALKAAIATHVNNDTIYLGQGMFNVGDVSATGMGLKTNVAVIGQGQNLTYVKGFNDPNALFIVSKTNYISGLSLIPLDGFAVISISSVPFGTLFLNDIGGISSGDFFYWKSLGVVVANNIRIKSSGVATAGDMWLQSAATNYLYNSYLELNDAGYASTAIKTTGGKLTVIGSTIVGLSASNNLVWANGGGSAVEFHGSTITDVGSSNLVVSGTATISVDAATVYDSTQTSGSITLLNSYGNTNLTFVSTGNGSGLTNILGFQPADSDLTNLANRIMVNIGSLSGSNGVVSLIHSDGSFTNFFPTANSDLGYGSALTNALAQHTNNDLIYVSASPYNYNIGARTYNLATNVGIIGPNSEAVTIIGSSVPIFNMSAYNYFQGFSITNPTFEASCFNSPALTGYKFQFEDIQAASDIDVYIFGSSNTVYTMNNCVGFQSGLSGDNGADFLLFNGLNSYLKVKNSSFTTIGGKGLQVSAANGLSEFTATSFKKTGSSATALFLTIGAAQTNRLFACNISSNAGTNIYNPSVGRFEVDSATVYDATRTLGIITTLNSYGNTNLAFLATLNGANLTNIPASGINLNSVPHIPVAVTLGASPFLFVNNSASTLECYFSGSVAYSISKNGAAVYGSLVGNQYLTVQPTNAITLTYTVAPTLFTNAW